MTTICPLCGAEIPTAKKCIDMFHELSLYTLSHPDPAFIHQHIVDAYGAQHINKDSKPVAMAATLIGLYLFAEKHYSGKEVQNAHVALGNAMKKWPPLSIPKEKAALTVMDALNTAPGKERDEMIKQWARAVWSIWKNQGITPLLEKLSEGVLKRYN